MYAMSGTGIVPTRPDPRSSRLKSIRRTLLIVLVLNLLVAAAKFGYGYWSGSVAMRADGVQSFLDGLSNIVALVSVAIAARPPDEDHHFGHERYETLASLLIAGMMSISVLQILRDSIGQLRSGEHPDVGIGSFGVILATMAVNIGVAVYEMRQGTKLNSELLRADARHTSSDVFVSLGVLIGFVLVQLGWSSADAIVSIVITGLIAWTAWTIVRDAMAVLSDATDVDARAVMRAILETEGVRTAHKLRMRSSGGRLLALVDITVDPSISVLEGHAIASDVELAIKDITGSDTSVTVHVEPALGRHTRPDMLFGDVQPHTETVDENARETGDRL
jgi:cation diffusion facilitator family transporter